MTHFSHTKAALRRLRRNLVIWLLLRLADRNGDVIVVGGRIWRVHAWNVASNLRDGWSPAIEVRARLLEQ